MVIIFILFFLVFTQPVSASPAIQITDFSSNSEPEWIQLTNNTSSEIILSNWSIEDTSNHSTYLNLCLSPNSSLIVENSSTWLNNTGGDTIYLYNSNREIIDELSYATGTNKPKPESTNTCVFTPTSIPPTSTPISTPTSTPTFVPTATPITSPSPIPDTTIINPDSGISLTEFMPYPSIEWIEIYNNNDKPVELKNWKIKDNSSTTKTIPDLKIMSKSFGIFEFSSFLNNDTDKIVLINHNNQIIGQYEYPNNKLTLEKSWSYISNSWCQSEITKNSPNASSCYQASTPTPTATPTIISTSTNLLTPTAIPTDRNLYKLDESATASAVFTPTEEIGYYLTPTVSIAPISSNLVLGETTTAKKNYLPLIFIVSGGSLLVSPLVIDKFKKK